MIMWKLIVLRSWERGSAILVSLVLISLIAFAAAYLPQLMEKGVKSAQSSFDGFEAQLLAEDLLEVGKYLMLYEKVFHLDNPLMMVGSGEINGSSFQSRRDGVRALWGQQIGSLRPQGISMIQSCGGYDNELVYRGTQKLQGKEVMCPLYLRSSLLHAQVLEKILFDEWVKRDLLTAKGLTPGVFRVTNKSFANGAIDFTQSLNAATGANDPNFIPLNVGQNILRRASELNLKGYLDINVLSQKSGFYVGETAKFIQVNSRIETGESFLGTVPKFITQGQTLMIIPSTMKEYALFILYPLNSSGSATTKFHEAVQLQAGVKIFGKVFFNGDIYLQDTSTLVGMKNSLQTLPDFKDVVIIAGTFKDKDGLAIGLPPDPEIIDLMQKKFAKGIITNYSTGRFLYDGKTEDVAFVNGTQMSTGGMDDYFAAIPGCEKCLATIDDSGNKYDCTADPQANNIDCGNGSINEFINSGAKAITINLSDYKYARVMTPTKSLVVSSPQTQVQGLVVGGHIRADHPDVEFHSLLALHPGSPGITDDNELKELNDKVRAIRTGVTSPLVNMPVVFTSAN